MAVFDVRKDYAYAGGKLEQIKAAATDIGWHTTLWCSMVEGKWIPLLINDFMSGRELLESFVERSKTGGDLEGWMSEIEEYARLAPVENSSMRMNLLEITATARTVFAGSREIKTLERLQKSAIRTCILCDIIQSKVEKAAKEARSGVQKVLA